MNWQEDHFSFDCEECGDYAMSRPCISCGGKCGSVFRRNVALVSSNFKIKLHK